MEFIASRGVPIGADRDPSRTATSQMLSTYCARSGGGPISISNDNEMLQRWEGSLLEAISHYEVNVDVTTSSVPIQIVALHRMVVNQKMNERLKLAMVEKRSQ